MANVSEHEANVGLAGSTEQGDRRRPGRLASVSPELVPLLRGQSVPSAELEPSFGDPDQLGGIRALVAGVALSIPLWAVLGLLGRALLF